MNLLVADDVGILLAERSGGIKQLPSNWHLFAPGHELTTGRDSHYLARRVDALMDESMQMHIALDVPIAGRYPIELKFFHGELRPAVRVFWLLTVPERGEATISALDPTELPIAR